MAENSAMRDSVEASMHYIVGSGESPVIYLSEAGGCSERHTGQHEDMTVAIRNGRTGRSHSV